MSTATGLPAVVTATAAPRTTALAATTVFTARSTRRSQAATAGTVVSTPRIANAAANTAAMLSDHERSDLVRRARGRGTTTPRCSRSCEAICENSERLPCDSHIFPGANFKLRYVRCQRHLASCRTDEVRRRKQHHPQSRRRPPTPRPPTTLRAARARPIRPPAGGARLLG